MGRILAICTSNLKGTPKVGVESASLIKDHGIEGDAHAGNWHRQVSLLSFEKIEEFKNKGIDVDFGAFGENIVVEGIDLKSIRAGDRVQLGKALLEFTQIGKECHNRCRIYETVGDCIMPREGVFARVLRDGHIEVGQEAYIIE